MKRKQPSLVPVFILSTQVVRNARVTYIPRELAEGFAAGFNDRERKQPVGMFAFADLGKVCPAAGVRELVPDTAEVDAALATSKRPRRVKAKA